MELTQQQREFFDTFGYLVFPGLMKDKIDLITSEFRAVFDDKGVAHEPSKRTCIVPFIDQREKLCTLLDDPRINAIASGVIGDDFNYLGSDGNYYTGDTHWHADGQHRVGKYIKIAFYLDPVTRTTGALRVIPGTHRQSEMGDWHATQAIQAENLWGIPQNEVPSIALESTPGDVVMFNHNLMHAAFGGNTHRRMFTINACQHVETPAEIKELENYIAGAARFWVDHLHGDVMRDTASETRMRHLKQVMEHEGHLPALSAKAKLSMSEPARG